MNERYLRVISLEMFLLLDVFSFLISRVVYFSPIDFAK